MILRILGAGAGGGLPQWNCGCRNCVDAREGRITPMTQSSLAVSADGEKWVIVNASPDIRSQLEAFPALHPSGPREIPIAAVLLTNADLDHLAGLLSLREDSPFSLYATSVVHNIINSNSVFGVLHESVVIRKEIKRGEWFQPIQGLMCRAFSVPGKLPRYMENPSDGTACAENQTVGFIIQGSGSKLAYIPGCADLPDWLIEKILDVDLLMFDGTVWQDDDMAVAQVGAKTGREMGHVPIDGAQGSLARLSEILCRKIFIHINNTNPILQPGSIQRSKVLSCGWEIATDEMTIRM